MAQWTNFQRIKRFVNPMWPYITCEKSVCLHLVEPSLTAGRLAGSLTVQQMKFMQGLKFLRFAVD